MIKIQEDRDFLVCQRQEGRPGAMAGVDKQLACVEEKIRIRVDAVEKQKQKAVSEIQEASKVAVLEDSSSEGSYDGRGDEEYRAPGEHQKRKRKIVSSEVASFLDRTKTSDRNALRVLASTSQAHSGAKSKNPGQKSIFFSEPNYDFLNDRYPEHKKKVNMIILSAGSPIISVTIQKK